MPNQKLYFDQNDKLVFDDRISPNPLVMLSPSGATPGGSYVTDGLYLYLDPGDTDSYPGSGTNVTDLALNTTGSLIDMSWDSSDGGRFILSDTSIDRYINMPYNANQTISDQWSYYLFLKIVNIGTNTPVFIDRINFDKQGMFYISTGFVVYAQGYFTDPPEDGYITATTENWTCICFTKQTGSTDNYSGYLNGQNQFTKSSTKVLYPGNSDLYIGSRLLWGPASKWEGYLGAVLLYNRSLTASEVTQNYNFFKSRYGLT